jgi:hypothetical protein
MSEVTYSSSERNHTFIFIEIQMEIHVQCEYLFIIAIHNWEREKANLVRRNMRGGRDERVRMGEDQMLKELGNGRGGRGAGSTC